MKDCLYKKEFCLKCSQRVKEFIAEGKTFSFMNSIKGTPAHWKKFFLTLSCAVLWWDELTSIIYKLDGVDIVDAEIKRMSYH